MEELEIYNEKVGATFTKLLKLNGMIMNGKHIICTDIEALK